jgi:hypothetical protein
MSLNYKDGSGLQDHKIGRPSARLHVATWQVARSYDETRLKKNSIKEIDNKIKYKNRHK